MKKATVILSLLLVLIQAYGQKQKSEIRTFTNPILTSGADPWIIFKDGFYYYSNSGGSGLVIRKAENLDGMRMAEQKTVWSPPQGTAYSRELWAPELHFIRGKWYMYFAADSGNNRSHRMYVIENPSPDPTQGTWEFKGKVTDPNDKWAIDGSVFEYSGKLYMIWSGWEGDVNGQQAIYLALMKNPWTIDGNRVLISAPFYAWEKNGDLNNPNDVPHVNVNEGPVALINKNKLFVIFSASGCWTDNYCLGMLTFTGSDNLLDADKWKKNPMPVFQQKPELGVFAPGHNSFFKSPDGKENWILYHANAETGQGCGRFRSPRAQKFTFKRDGTPDFGDPLKAGIPTPVPSTGSDR